MRKKVGNVSNEERNEIQILFERKNGLIELAQILGTNEELYDKLIKDMGETEIRLQQWWSKMSIKYNWESSENGSWEINFDNGEIYLEG